VLNSDDKVISQPWRVPSADPGLMAVDWTIVNIIWLYSIYMVAFLIRACLCVLDQWNLCIFTKHAMNLYSASYVI
jgi:hypothetical protein